MTDIDHLSRMNACFLGPRSENEAWLRSEMQAILDSWFGWRRDLFPDDPEAIPYDERVSVPFLQQREKLARQISRLTDILRDEVPKHTPRYIGHMVSEISMPALLGHFSALLHNPNNTSKEVSKVTSVLEAEAITALAAMVGYDPAGASGHFTSGGTVANFEAIWRARFRLDHWLSLALYLAEEHGLPLDVFRAAHMGWKRYFELIAMHGVDEGKTRHYSLVASNPFEAASLLSAHTRSPYKGPVVLVPGNKHFSWLKGVSIFGFGERAFWTIPLDGEGRTDVAVLADLLDRAEKEGRPVLMVVSVAGTTEAGEVDPVDRVQDLLDERKATRGQDIWHHVDAAYGGFFASLLGGVGENLLAPGVRAALAALGRAQSITLDPHKLGYVPYSCGAFLARDREAYSVSSFHAPYLDRADLGASVWAYTLEGSRSAAGATAVWLTSEALGFDPAGFGQIIASTIENCRLFAKTLTTSLPFVRTLQPLDTNIFCFNLAEPGMSLAEANRRTEAVFRKFVASPHFSVSRTSLSRESYEQLIAAHMAGIGGAVDADAMVLLRCVFMNPFWASADVHAQLMPEFVAELAGHYGEVSGASFGPAADGGELPRRVDIDEAVATGPAHF
ncbi:pyridoxal phosphate-dependent decarboxylase family protein [Gimibacter soli]|uniref:Pyridoxal-dependent decarboxylase n=1 Tax=Gimibacter soli TaxID=3024400 RepID=A0AAE9XUV6_9PROT|nr:pyridoxal-dependent decarboxylase [Gimibacter soli]WCL55566.1 pyridoxal-dependent decarboxylase [Gimibacter soli]